MAETAQYRRLAKHLGYANVTRADLADVLVVNTCGFSAHAEAESLAILRTLARKYPDRRIIASGCLPAIDPDALARTFHGPTTAAGDLDTLGELLTGRSADYANMTRPVEHADPEDLTSTRPENRLLFRLQPIYMAIERRTGAVWQPMHNIVRTAAFSSDFRTIVVSRGCTGTCNYCAVKLARGPLRSKPLADIIQEFRAGLDSGAQDFWLVADDVGCWGRDFGKRLPDLLEAILAIPDPFTLVINYIAPDYFLRYRDELLALIADPRVVNVNVPLQSGSASVVRRMSRPYLPSQVLDALQTLARKNPSLVLKTHLMVGFPGETEEDFQRTLDVVPHFHLIVPFAYTTRPGTTAAHLSQNVPLMEKQRRFKRLRNAIIARYLHISLSTANDLLQHFMELRRP